MDSTFRSATGGAERRAAPWIERLARFGYAAKGVVYCLVGVLAAKAALSGGAAEGSRQALRSIAGGGFGRVLLGAIAVGLAGYVIWCAARAILDPENDGGGTRFFLAIVALIYAALAVQSARLALGGPASGGGQAGGGAQHWSATLMSQPLGRWLVGLVGVVIAGYGLQQIVQAYRVELDQRLALSLLSRRAREWVVGLSRFGLSARGVVFGIIGAFFVTAAAQANPNDARGLGGALRALQRTTYGPWLLGAVALGLIAYGVYNLIRARYRRIRPT